MNVKRNSFYDSLIRIIILILCFLSPFLMLTYGKKISISSYWETPLQPLFLMTNALTTYMFFNIPKWRISAILLFLLTIFSVEYYPKIHDVFAIGFFVSNLYPLLSIKRYRLMIMPYFLSLIWLPDIFWVEVQAIIILCIYHLILIIKFYNLNRTN
jgi:hypothetical protein